MEDLEMASEEQLVSLMEQDQSSLIGKCTEHDILVMATLEDSD